MSEFAGLVQRVSEGERGAEAALVERFGRGVRLLLERHTGFRPEAEDLFQDTFRLVIEKLRRGELRQPESLPGFVAGVARSLAIEHYRKLARRRTDTLGEDLPDVPAAGPGPLGRVLDEERARAVRRVLGELPNARDREVLLRFYLSDEDRGRIAADHGLEPGQFDRVLYRARQRYKELYLRRAGALRVLLLLLLLLQIVPAISRALAPLSVGRPTA